MSILVGLAIGVVAGRLVLPLFGRYVARAEQRVRHVEFGRPH